MTRPAPNLSPWQAGLLAALEDASTGSYTARPYDHWTEFADHERWVDGYSCGERVAQILDRVPLIPTDTGSM